jgi:hypothetical protein
MNNTEMTDMWAARRHTMPRTHNSSSAGQPVDFLQTEESACPTMSPGGIASCSDVHGYYFFLLALLKTVSSGKFRVFGISLIWYPYLVLVSIFFLVYVWYRMVRYRNHRSDCSLELLKCAPLYIIVGSTEYILFNMALLPAIENIPPYYTLPDWLIDCLHFAQSCHLPYSTLFASPTVLYVICVPYRSG